jgi:hypothetical protein
MDARRLGYDKSYIALFLKAAENRIVDIKRRSGNLSPDLTELENAVKQATNELFGYPNDTDPTD